MQAARAPALLVLASALAAQQPQDLVLQEQQRRTEVVALCAPAVCAVMKLEGAGGGSGVVFDPAGFVLTNYHVVGDPDPRHVLPEPPAPPEQELSQWRAAHPEATEAEQQLWVAAWQQAWKDEHHPRGTRHYAPMKVGLPDGELRLADVLGIDPGSDLAVLKLRAEPGRAEFAWRPLGDSDALLAGETVLAMGNPFLLATDFTPTVTFGIVSATHRYQEGQGNRMLVYPDCIQVDAPINPGNSGGPLFNERGEVVGINGRISVGARGRVNAGVGFAISASQVRNFLADLMSGRHAEHGTLDMSAWFMKEPGADSRRAVFVQQLFKDSVAAVAGVGLGDELLRFDGHEVRSANQLATMIGVLPAGAWVSLAWRPAGAAAAREALVQLARLDTGSSRDGSANQRLASRAHRRAAAAAVVARWRTAGTATVTPAAFGIVCGDQSLRWRRSGDELVVEVDGRVLGSGSAEDVALLARERAANPMLLAPPELVQRLGGTLLAGGTHVFGRPAWRFELAGEGSMEVLVHDDGRPAGWVLRDPVHKVLREVHVAHDGRSVRVLHDGRLQDGWRVEGAELDRAAAAGEATSSPYAFSERAPRTELEQLVDRLLPSVVKVHGASGIATIEAYASGIVVSAQGHVLTLDQVMLQEGRTRVVLHDGSVHEAQLLPEMPGLGVRLLKIDPANVSFPLAPVWPATGTEPAFRTGDACVSIGNCFRLAEFSEKLSATFGIVVGRANTALRYRLSDVKYDGDLVLTDASNNPGHYGGGLFTLDGRWIGVNARLLDSKETNTKLSAAVPARDVLPYLEQYVLGRQVAMVEKTVRPVFTGIVLFDQGGRASPPAYVDRVVAGSPAARAGLRADDLVVRVDDYAVRTCKELRDVLQRYAPGQQVTVTFKRGDAVKTATLALEEPR